MASVWCLLWHWKSLLVVCSSRAIPWWILWEESFVFLDYMSRWLTIFPWNGLLLSDPSEYLMTEFCSILTFPKIFWFFISLPKEVGSTSLYLWLAFFKLLSHSLFVSVLLFLEWKWLTFSKCILFSSIREFFKDVGIVEVNYLEFNGIWAAFVLAEVFLRLSFTDYFMPSSSMILRGDWYWKFIWAVCGRFSNLITSIWFEEDMLKGTWRGEWMGDGWKDHFGKSAMRWCGER